MAIQVPHSECVKLDFETIDDVCTMYQYTNLITEIIISSAIEGHSRHFVPSAGDDYRLLADGGTIRVYPALTPEISTGSSQRPKNRLDKRKFYYITLLRDPVSRYLSEWRHVQRGATWKTSLHMCDGRTPTPEELPPCYEGTDWSGCTLQQFMECPYNLANNRQVRMLADLSLVGCYNMSFIPEKKRAQILLESAKKNLRDMAFFGLTEFQRKTQYLFERTFHLKFIRPFVQYNSTRAAGVDLDNDTIQRIEELNELDVQLYDYARDLFQQRYMYKRQLERREQRLKNLRRSSGSIASPVSRDEA
ncbi:hypothetical protein QTP86_027335, partial [Hemibagrus guttatus]